MADSKLRRLSVFPFLGWTLLGLFCGCQTVRFQNPDAQLPIGDGLTHSTFEDLPPGDDWPPFDGDLERESWGELDLEAPLDYGYANDASSDFQQFPTGRRKSIWSRVRQDYAHFYNAQNLPLALSTLGVGAWMANTNIDQNVLEHIQGDITLSESDEIYELIGEHKILGDGYFMVPVYIGTSLIGNSRYWPENVALSNLGEWGDRSWRGVLVGFPPLIAAQHVLGGSRPNETAEGSEWQFFGDNNAVSGHSFMGAIPFLTAARMTKNRPIRFALIGASALPALSRITEDGHFPSQALMGWMLAFISVESVARTSDGNESGFRPWITQDSIGIGFSFRR